MLGRIKAGVSCASTRDASAAAEGDESEGGLGVGGVPAVAGGKQSWGGGVVESFKTAASCGRATVAAAPDEASGGGGRYSVYLRDGDKSANPDT